MQIEEDIQDRWFNSSITNLTSSHVLNGLINDVILDFEKDIEKSKATSFPHLVSVDRLEIKTAKSKAIVGGSYIELPEYIKNKKACVNIKILMKNVLNDLF